MTERDEDYYGDQCARCGSSADAVWCDNCDRDGMSHHDCGEDVCCCLYPEDNVPCDWCDGRGWFGVCLSTPEFCEANPLPGRENVKRGTTEPVYVKRGVG